jgi:hypothetical protein
MALRHPSATLRLSALHVLASSHDDDDDDATTMPKDRYLFDTLFHMIATDSEPAVVARAAQYIVTVALWDVAAVEGLYSTELSSGVLEMAITAICQAMERWGGGEGGSNGSNGSNGSDLVSASDREVLL